MPIERCDECGFDGSLWTDAEAIAAIAELPERWRRTVADVEVAAAVRRPIDQMWSIAEYVDHVRETLFGMRFVLDMAFESPDADLGEPPEPAFTPGPRQIDVSDALMRLSDEANELHARLIHLGSDQWRASVRFGGEDHDAHWICRHAVHDATHHLGDVDRLKAALVSSA